MICKNCGYDNDDKKFICENCGYALYDEDKSIEEQQNNGDIEKTQTFDKAIVGDSKAPAKAEVEKVNDDEEAKKKQIAIIIALAVVLVVIIVSIIVGIANSNKKDDIQPSETTTEQTTILNDVEKETTEAPTSTTAPTTQAPKLSLGLSCNAGGSVTGDGTYELGENATVIAKPDNGYEFGGWYVGNNKVSSNKKYTFTMTENIALKAVFIYVSIEDEPTDITDDTTEVTQIESINGADD